MTPYLESKLIGTLFGESFAVPDLWLGLTDAGVEVSGAGYFRQPLKAKLNRGNAPTLTQKIEFPLAMDEWGMVDGAMIYDAQQGGNALWPTDIPTQDVKPSRRVVIMPGQLRLSLRK